MQGSPLISARPTEAAQTGQLEWAWQEGRAQRQGQHSGGCPGRHLSSLPAKPRSSWEAGAQASRWQRAQVSCPGLDTLFYTVECEHLPNNRGGDRPSPVPDVIITSVHASSGSPHTPGTTPSALSHLPTPAAPSSESHTYLSQTTRPTPTAPHVANRPRPANNYSHSSPIPVVQTAPAADHSSGVSAIGHSPACPRQSSGGKPETPVGCPGALGSSQGTAPARLVHWSSWPPGHQRPPGAWLRVPRQLNRPDQSQRRTVDPGSSGAERRPISGKWSQSGLVMSAGHCHPL